jgi:hypothetical protein
MADTQIAQKEVKNEATKEVVQPKKEGGTQKAPAAVAQKGDAWYSKWWSGVKGCCGRTDPKDLAEAKTDGKTTAEADAKNTETGTKKTETGTKKTEIGTKETKTTAP